MTSLTSKGATKLLRMASIVTTSFKTETLLGAKEGGESSKSRKNPSTANPTKKETQLAIVTGPRRGIHSTGGGRNIYAVCLLTAQGGTWEGHRPP